MVQIHGSTLQVPAEKNQAVKDLFFHACNEEERCIPIMERKIPIATVIFAYAIFIFRHLIHVTRSIKEFFFLVFFL